MAGEPAFIAQAVKPGIDGIFAHPVGNALGTGEQVLLGGFELFKHETDDFPSLGRESHDVGRNVRHALAPLLCEQLALLERGDRDDPQTALQVEPVGRGQAKLARTHARQQEQAGGQQAFWVSWYLRSA